MATKTKLIIQVEKGIDVEIVTVPARNSNVVPVIGPCVTVDPTAAPINQATKLRYDGAYRWNAAGCARAPGNGLCT